MTGFFDIIILLGAIQGFIVSALLFFSGRNKPSNRLLATLILLLSLASLNLYLSGIPSLGSNRAWNIFSAIMPMVIIMPVGPLIFLYTRSFLDPHFSFSKADRRHFYPVIVDLIPYLVMLLYIIGLLTGIFKHDLAWGNFVDTWNVYADIPRWMSVTTYLLLSVRYIRAAKSSENSQWLRQYIRVFLFFQLTWLVYLVPYTIPRYTDRLLNAVGWYPVYVPLAVLIYWLGIKGYMIEQARSAVVAKKAVALTALPGSVLQQTMDLLKKAMEEDRLYLRADLNLAIMAGCTGIPQKRISAVLNQHMHKSFNEFVNEYRVEAFKEKIQEPGMNHLTIAGVALECGFNSQASFQRIFKQATGMVPSSYRDSSGKTMLKSGYET